MKRPAWLWMRAAARGFAGGSATVFYAVMAAQFLVASAPIPPRAVRIAPPTLEVPPVERAPSSPAKPEVTAKAPPAAPAPLRSGRDRAPGMSVTRRREGPQAPPHAPSSPRPLVPPRALPAPRALPPRAALTRKEALERLPNCGAGHALQGKMEEWASDDCRRTWALTILSVLNVKIRRCEDEWDASSLVSIIESLQAAQTSCGPFADPQLARIVAELP